jgi:hypothetical protein
MSNRRLKSVVFSLCMSAALCGVLLGQTPSRSVVMTVSGRERVNTTEWFSATPEAEVYGHVDSLLRISFQQRIHAFDWQAELGQAAELFLPTDAVSPVTAQGQLGLGGTYYASNGNNAFPAAAYLKSGFVRYHFKGDKGAIRVGRFEFFEGAETTPKNATLAWLQNARMAQRMIGNFGFANAQRSFDGVDTKASGTNWDVTAMAARSDQGVFNMNANPELNVDAQYLAYTRYLAQQHVIVRGFAIGYHDGRTGVVKTDNRPLAVRQADHRNIRIGSYGASAMAAIPAAGNTFDLLFWGVLQNGQWGALDHRAGVVAVEGGFKANAIRSQPWLRGGFLRATGDNNPNDGQHNTFFQMLTTPRNYARFPFFNMMNSSEQFVQLIDKPTAKLELRSDLHFLHLTASNDLWYQSGGAFDNKVFGFTGRPGTTSGSFATLVDISADYAVTKQVTLTAYYAHASGKTVIAAIYPQSRNAQYGFFELNYRFAHVLGGEKH